MKIYSQLLLILFLSCKTEKNTLQPTGLVTSKAMVVSAREEASQIGAQIMQEGGNAFDAMIATASAMGITTFTHPENYGLSLPAARMILLKSL